MLSIFRLHGVDKKTGRPCPKSDDPYWKRCSCPMWIRGTHNGVKLKESLKTRSWERATELLEERQKQNNPRLGRQGPKRIVDAIESFLAASSGGTSMRTALRNLFSLDPEHLGRLPRFCRDRGLEMLEELNLDAVTQFRATWTCENKRLKNFGQPMAENSVLLNIRLLRTFFTFCIDRDWITKNPAKKLKARRPNHQKDPFEPGEFERVLTAVNVWFAGRHDPYTEEFYRETRALILLMRHSGLRISDAVNLRRDEVVPSSAGDGRGVMLNQTKVGSHVYIPLPVVALAALDEVERPGPYYFRSPAGELVSHTKTWRTRLMRVFEVAQEKVEPCTPFRHRPHPHRLRHTYAAEMLKKGVPLEIVSKLLGHSTVTITESHYAKFTRSRQAQLEAYVRGTWEGEEKANETTV